MIINLEITVFFQAKQLIDLPFSQNFHILLQALNLRHSFCLRNSLNSFFIFFLQ